jgi:8-oxo-dGTP pyrophosphatase MutT (NUDIX family)
MSDVSIVALDRMAFSFAPRAWPFAQARRAEIAAHFAARRARTPAIWNGRVLLMSEWSLNARSICGTFFETEYANFVAWRDWNFPDRSVTNCFAMGAIRTADGAFLLGVMSSHTVNAGKIYFPAGTPDPHDVAGDVVDLAGNVAREVAEETGLTGEDVSVLPGWTALLAGPHIALIQVLQARVPAADLRERVLDHLAREQRPELCDVRIVRSRADFDPMMPPFVTAYLENALAARV